MNLKENKIGKIFSKKRNNSLNVVDLFSGCGGLSLGFKNAGFNILCAVDFDKDSLDTLRKNEVAKHSLNIDLFNSKAINTIRENINFNDIDLVVGGPPCQGFSLTGTRNYHDKRNQLYRSMKNLIKHSQPKVFLIENVKGMATLYKGRVKKDVIHEFSKLGYKVSTKILNSKYYGVPQSRERLFFVGFRENLNTKFIFPKKILNDDILITCKEAISDLPSLNDLKEIKIYPNEPESFYQYKIRNGSKILKNHLPTFHTDEVINVIKQVPEGGNHKDLPDGVGNSRKFNEAWTRYHGDKPSKTIDTGHRNHFHYKYNRVPTVRENCRLQSFPDTFEILGTKTSQDKQVGNAVPVLLSKIIAESIYEQIKNS